ncbi:cell division protein ZipA [Pasteurella langaaensis DSM 22999]|uniref:Cell division protein ZipA n=1 Tax=Alitibacter langaaensis DSM 22999 TaxID=1122935 RepID=A0A2U0TCZ0_9PAST|nr:cell division protein ZipA [Pasteurella langaaensis]PVX41459.1 cell division protein ZipA [Pasteurella langaaensis DSM 22999]
MDLNTILIILGIIALIGLVGHGIWSNRREKSLYFDNVNTFSRESSRTTLKSAETTTPDFAQKPQGQALQQENQPVQQTLEQHVETAAEAYSPAPQSAQSVNEIRITLPNEQPTVSIQPEPAPAATTAMNAPVHYEYQPEIKQPSANPVERSLDELSSFAEIDDGVNSSNPEIRISLQDAAISSPISQPKPVEPIQPVAQETQNVESSPEGYVMLYVVAAENRQLQGAALAQALDSLGFIMGHDGIYHRHLDLTVASPVIFSVANVNQPGTFPYNMHEFATVGVVLYMQLPSVGNNRTNLKMMIQAAKTLATQLEAFVLTDDEREFDANAEEDYLARV